MFQIYAIQNKTQLIMYRDFILPFFQLAYEYKQIIKPRFMENKYLVFYFINEGLESLDFIRIGFHQENNTRS